MNLFDPYFSKEDIGMAVTFEAVRHYDEIEVDAHIVNSGADRNDDGLLTRDEFLDWARGHAIMRQYIDKPNLLFGTLVETPKKSVAAGLEATEDEEIPA